MSLSVCMVVGARPNFMKVAPVYRALREMVPDVELSLVHTGQHYDPELSDVFLDDLRLPLPNFFLGIGSGTHAEQTARAMVGVEGILNEQRPDLVVVPGDVNSTLAAALAAVKLRIPVAHLEAGLRSFDPAMPEEHNRKLVDHMSSLLLTHSASAGDNLAAEGIVEGVHLVGNTMIDSVLAHLELALARQPWADLGVEPGSYALVTLHRPSLVDDDARLTATVAELGELRRTVEVVFPVHPRTHVRLASLGLLSSLEQAGVVVSQPLGYFAFLGLEAQARFVLTDSGGIQEETSALGVRCFTLRSTTERPVTVELGTNTVLGADPARIGDIPGLLDCPSPGLSIPWWDGSAGPRAAAIILDQLGV